MGGGTDKGRVNIVGVIEHSVRIMTSWYCFYVRSTENAIRPMEPFLNNATRRQKHTTCNYPDMRQSPTFVKWRI